jgi:ribosomal protein S18 acetylase RimI-like enzyme
MFDLVRNDPKYWDFIRTLRNNPNVQSGFIEVGNITKIQQDAYMAKHSDEYFICLYDDNPVGFVGVVEDDIRVCTHPDHQRMGVGLFMIEEIRRLYPQAFAKVKIDNISSLRMFEKAGYELKYYILE